MSPVADLAEVVSTRPVGAYTHLVVHSPGAARDAAPGQFAACGTGDTGMLLRRSFSLLGADPAAGTLDVVVAASGPGTRRITALRPGDALSLTAPLGRPFPLPEPGTPAVVVGGGYGAAPLGWLARVLRARGSAVHAVLGAGSLDRLLGTSAVDTATALDAALDGRVPLADTTTITTDDGSAGTRGRVTDVLPAVVQRARADAGIGAGAGRVWVYACGPMAMLRAVHATATAAGARSFLAVEESMACGIGVCMTCVLPVVGADGATRMVRTCTEGPTFPGEALRWDAIGARGATVPADAVGAPAPVAPAAVGSTP